MINVMYVYVVPVLPSIIPVSATCRIGLRRLTMIADASNQWHIFPVIGIDRTLAASNVRVW